MDIMESETPMNPAFLELCVWAEKPDGAVGVLLNAHCD